MIVKLKPALKSAIWGGVRLGSEWGKDGGVISESWELSLRADSPSVIVGGEFGGKPLCEVATRKDFGKNCEKFSCFPVLNKLIDSAKPLSVQVHPSDGYALKREGQPGKTEVWHILSVQDGAYIYLGFNRDVAPGELDAAVADGTVCGLLNKIYVKAGESYFIPSGVVHSIGAGVTLFEIQQNSDLTYRIYDYGRLGADGKPRELHTERAKEVLSFNKLIPEAETGELIGRCEYFTAVKRAGAGEIGFDASFASVTVTDGIITVGDMRCLKGETVFLSAGERAKISGGGSYILTYVE